MCVRVNKLCVKCQGETWDGDGVWSYREDIWIEKGRKMDKDLDTIKRRNEIDQDLDIINLDYNSTLLSKDFKNDMHGVAELMRENKVFLMPTPCRGKGHSTFIPWHMDVVVQGLLGRATCVGSEPCGNYRPVSALTRDIRDHGHRFWLSRAAYRARRSGDNSALESMCTWMRVEEVAPVMLNWEALEVVQGVSSVGWCNLKIGGVASSKFSSMNDNNT